MTGTARDKDSILYLGARPVLEEAHCWGNEASVLGDRGTPMGDLKYLTRPLLSCSCRRDSSGDMQSNTAQAAASQLKLSDRRVLACWLRWNGRQGSRKECDVVSRSVTAAERGELFGD